ncbi:WD40 repeat-like protein [Athelia psychrophila]|uniref:WD40 repeat-like protein n=1 Tax=Athelia psychrophila TaxID=1759441 RepID=A0A166I232_9AGAM|nr:WD40 repeat-like protein [Fibularhizoctonia sp. CBS 109695]
MPPSDSEGEEIDDEFENGTSEAEQDEDAEAEEDIDPLDNDGDDATEGDDDSASEDSDEGSEEEDDDESEDDAMDVDGEALAAELDETTGATPERDLRQNDTFNSPETGVERELSPAQLRKRTLLLPAGATYTMPRSYAVVAVCAIAHPTPTHGLAHSLCMTHLLTGSDDGYIRDYDIFAAVNGNAFLTAPQRHHCGVVEGIMKAGQIRYWWENPKLGGSAPEESSIAPVYSLLLQSDALWSLAGSNTGHINLSTVRHETGKLCHVMNGHRGPVSALSMEHDEKGFLSAGWDGEALQWDLNTGQIVRKFTAHGSQLVAVAVRPISSGYSAIPAAASGAQEDISATGGRSETLHNAPDTSESAESVFIADVPPPAQPMGKPIGDMEQAQDSDTKSDVSYDPLFDDEPDANGEPDNGLQTQTQESYGLSVPSPANKTPSTLAVPSTQPSGRNASSSAAVPKNAPPLLDPVGYSTFSPNVLMTASIDGQVILWDKRVSTPKKGVGRLEMSEKTPPWCVSVCWSTNGAHIYAGRRNGAIDVWDVRQFGRSGIGGTPRLLKTLRNPASSGVVSCVVPFPDGRHIACASIDNIRLWNAAEAGEADAKTKSGVQFKIIPGHHGGYISQMVVDPAARFMVSASSNRGWHGESTRTVFVHDIKQVQ